MSDDEGRPRRGKRESSYKAKAFEKFKQLKSGARKKYEIEEIDNVYETVDENEYTKQVLDRQDDDWIVDDGTGYVEDGRDIFDDDLDKDSIAAASQNRRKPSHLKKKGIAENAGKGSLRLMLSNLPNKKKEEEKLNEDETLCELLKEIDVVKDFTPAKSKPKTYDSPLSVKKRELDYLNAMQSSSKRQKLNNTENNEKLLDHVMNSAPVNESVPSTKNIPSTSENCTIDSEITATEIHEECEFGHEFLDNLDIDVFDKPPEEQAPVEAPMHNWNLGNSNSDQMNVSIDVSTCDFPLVTVEEQQVFRFFWWDAFEDQFVHPGVVFFFGRVYLEQNKSYQSCCVAVRNIERQIYFLPKVRNKGDEPVTGADVYNEINNSVMKRMQIKQFKSRIINKKYVFDPTVPTESDYVEVRYSARDPKISHHTSGDTFSRVFGTESSYLEILLLERKIKGPCWLDIKSPVAAANPMSWCKFEINCLKASDISIVKENLDRPPLIVSAISVRRAVKPSDSSNEVVMVSCATNKHYFVDKQEPSSLFQSHFCVFTNPSQIMLPLDLHDHLIKYQATSLQKVDSERALLNYFCNNFAKLDTDLIVGHDLHGGQINILAERMVHHQITNFSKLGRTKRSNLNKQKLEKELFIGRLVCDLKISCKELIRSRGYELGDLCHVVLKQPEGSRIALEPEDIPRMFTDSVNIIKLAGLTRVDLESIFKIMYQLNVIPLALQITNIAGNVMSKTLLGGRAERNEFLLLHAFTEKGYIAPEKHQMSKRKETTAGKKKAAYAGGLVLDPKVGLYDNMIVLMDFNSLYPSIIQEYNICFTTIPPSVNEKETLHTPDKNLPLGILPTEIRKLVESRREVKKLMKTPELSRDQYLLYDIRQMALKLTANSMYGCLGFTNSRFYGMNLAALITHKGREILTNTKDLVEKMNFEVVYGDTDSLMINTHLNNYEQVLQVGVKIKQEVNKLYKQIELDIDGVFKRLLLLKKKKYAAVVLSKGKSGELMSQVEYKGLDIVRRDWSRIASESGKFVLNQILSDLSSEDCAESVLRHLKQVRLDLETGKIPLSLFVITKQLVKSPGLYNDVKSLPHVQVAIRYNAKSGGVFRAGDTVPYVICDDGTKNSAAQRAYHIEEIKNNNELKIDVKYYLTSQIHSVISRICAPIETLDPYELGACLGADLKSIEKKLIRNDKQHETDNVADPAIMFQDCEPFVFKCFSCQQDNTVRSPMCDTGAVLARCQNPACGARPVDYVPYIQKQVRDALKRYTKRYYDGLLYCEDPTCPKSTRKLPSKFHRNQPMCDECNETILLATCPAQDLHHQILFLNYIFDLSKLPTRPLLDYSVELAYNSILSTIEERAKKSAYSVVSMRQVISVFENFESENKSLDRNTEGGEGQDEEDY